MKKLIDALRDESLDKVALGYIFEGFPIIIEIIDQRDVMAIGLEKYPEAEFLDDLGTKQVFLLDSGYLDFEVFDWEISNVGRVVRFYNEKPVLAYLKTQDVILSS